MSHGCQCCHDGRHDGGFSKSTRYARFVYAGIDGNVLVSSGKETPLISMSPDLTYPIYPCLKGNLEGFDPYAGFFTAPRTGFYDISLFCHYMIHNFWTSCNQNRIK